MNECTTSARVDTVTGERGSMWKTVGEDSTYDLAMIKCVYISFAAPSQCQLVA